MRSPIIALKVILTAVIVFAATSRLSSGTADSIIFQNDSTFTIEGYQNELQEDGDWIKVTKAEIDPDGVTQGDGFDDEINTDYVWRPRNMEPGWTPYTNGYWSYTNCGWMWTSFYSWGWRPYHYGRWWWSEYYGWVWSPGFVWAPAWVVWMYNDGYCGWYPISPRVRWHHDYGYRCHHMRYRVRHWTFCEKPKFHDPLHPPVVIVDPKGNGGIIPGSTYEGNVKIEGSTVINQGPSKNDIESASGRVIEKVDVEKYNNVTQVTGIKDDGRNNNSGKNTEVYNDTKKLYDKQYEYKEDNGGKTREKTSDGSGDKRVEKNQDPNTNKENQKTRESEKKTNEKTYEKTNEKTNDRSTEKKKDDTYKNNDTYKSNDRTNEKKSNDNTYKEKQKDTFKSNDRSNEKRSDEKRSNDNKQDSKPPKDNNDKGKNDNGRK